MDLRLPEAPRWAWFLIAACTVAVALLVPRALHHGAVSPAAPSSLSSVTSDEAAQSAAAPHILVIGDAYTAGSADGGTGAARWTAVVAEDLAAAGTPVDMTVAGAVGSGYLQAGATSGTFRDLVAQQAAVSPDVVVFFGSESDVAAPADVQAAATATYEQARQQWPVARLLVIGPAWRDGTPPENLVDTSAAVARAAAAAGAAFADPLAEGWFDDAGPLIGPDQGYPTDAGHREMADRIRPLLQQILADQPTAQTNAGRGPR